MKMDSKCASLYEQLAADRETYLTRAREAALVTIPTLVPPEGHSSSTKYYTPYQSVGARGVNNLAAKLLLSLLPPNSPFFRLQVDDYTAQEIAQTEGARAKVDEAFNRIERAVMTEIETIGLRSPGLRGSEATACRWKRPPVAPQRRTPEGVPARQLCGEARSRGQPARCGH